MNKTLSIVLSVFGIIALCVVGTGVLGLGALAAYDHNVRLQAPVMVVTEESVAQAPTETNPTQETVVENTPAPSATPSLEAPAQTATDSRVQMLWNLDDVYRSQGWEAWLKAAGVKFDSTKVESRQPVEDVLNGRVTVIGLVIRATDMEVNWPACISTDRPNEVSTSSSTRQHQPDLRNPSVLYTNVVLNGQATVYANCSDWGQLDPTK